MMAMGWIKFSVAALVLLTQIHGTFCQGDFMEKDIQAMDHFCVGLCYGKDRSAYNSLCKCDQIITTSSPCVGSDLHKAICDWSTRTCNGSTCCEWRKAKARNLIIDQFLGCNCHFVLSDITDPCSWSAKEVNLCSLLKENKLLYSDFKCLCSGENPTAPPSKSRVCEYTKHREAQLTPNISKRLFSGSDAYSCNYPGVVGLFKMVGSKRYAICTATLVNQTVIMFDHQCKNELTDPVKVLIESYDTTFVSADSNTVNLNTIIPLCAASTENKLYTAQLQKSVVLDSKCVQPACLPNVRIPANHINFDNCRVLGYGDTSDDTSTTGSQAAKLQEIKVKVDPTSVTNDLLEVTRVDGVTNTACLDDYSAPLVCSRKISKEWITVGIHQSVGTVCSGKTNPNTFEVTNLLIESIGNRYNEALKAYQPKPVNELPD